MKHWRHWRLVRDEGDYAELFPAVAIGHPVGMTGARIVLHVLKHLQRIKGRFGVAALCIGGGQGGAALLERTS